MSEALTNLERETSEHIRELERALSEINQGDEISLELKGDELRGYCKQYDKKNKQIYLTGSLNEAFNSSSVASSYKLSEIEKISLLTPYNHPKPRPLQLDGDLPANTD